MGNGLQDYEVIQELDKITNDLLQETKCPYTKVVGYLNKLSAIVGIDKMPKLKKSIAAVLTSVLTKTPTSFDEEYFEKHNLSPKNEAKLKKHMYDIAFIQSEYYEQIKSVLTLSEDSPFLYSAPLQMYSAENLQEREIRERWGITFFSIFQEVMVNKSEQWGELKEATDPIYNSTEQYTYIHSLLSKGEPLSMTAMLMQGAGDGFLNFRALVCNTPELYQAKYGVMPTAEQYRALIEKNIKKIILPIASLNLSALIKAVRPVSLSGDNRLHEVNNTLNIKTDYFELDENDILTVNVNYNVQIVRNSFGDIAEHKDAELHALLMGHPEPESAAAFPIRTGCPALAAKTKDNKIVVEQFCQDILSLLDEIYFPYRDQKTELN